MATLAANMNIERFIKDVENRPAIWNRSYHCNKQFMEETWRTLSRIHQLPIAALKAKWKGLRDNFRVEYKRIPRDENGELLIEPYEFQSKWTHYGALVFLVEHMRSRSQKIEPNDNDLSQGHDPYYYEVNPQQQFDDIGFHFINNNSIQIPDDDDEGDILGGIPLMNSNRNDEDGGCDDDDDEGGVSGIRLNHNNGGSNGDGGGGDDIHDVGEDVDDLISESSPSMHLDGIGVLPPLISIVDTSELVTPLLNGYDKNQQRNQMNGGGGRGNNGNISSSSSSVNRSGGNIPNKKRRISPSTNTATTTTPATQYKIEAQQNDGGHHRSTSVADQKIMDIHHQNHNNNHHINNHQNQNIDDDYHFLMSVHPYMAELSASQKLQVRMKIQKLVFNELYNSNGKYMD